MTPKCTTAKWYTDPLALCGAQYVNDKQNLLEKMISWVFRHQCHLRTALIRLSGCSVFTLQAGLCHDLHDRRIRMELLFYLQWCWTEGPGPSFSSS